MQTRYIFIQFINFRSSALAEVQSCLSGCRKLSQQRTLARHYQRLLLAALWNNNLGRICSALRDCPCQGNNNYCIADILAFLSVTWKTSSDQSVLYPIAHYGYRRLVADCA
jgi:hypothetical protein